MPTQKKRFTEAEIKAMRDIETYEHADKRRSNNPPIGMAQHDTAAEPMKSYAFDPHIDPTLDWAGKAEGISFDVPTSSIHIHESIKPHSIIARVTKEYSDRIKGQLAGQVSMFEAETPSERLRRRRETIEFYKHGVDWTNRLIAGDSLVIMNSLLEKEGMAGQVQMVYIDPPYGIKYGSNFQPFVDKRDVKDKKDEDLSQEPEMIKAFRDTWELGIHSYLTYLRNRLLLARELLADTGSVFVQISDENVHHVREICDEVFGSTHFISQIFLKKTTGAGAPSDLLTPASVGDYIVWYSKNEKSIKYRRQYMPKDISTDNKYRYVLLPDGTRVSISDYAKEKGENIRLDNLPANIKVYRLDNLTSQSGGDNARFPVEFNGKTYSISKGSWKTGREGMERLIQKNRIAVEGNSLAYIRYFDDFPFTITNNLWEDIGGIQSRKDPKVYVVQTATEVIKRCMLMTTDPGDLVLDITCGSGTTAYVAEQWGRRWITCDTSRV
ncbi:MAG: DNA methyltransferase, partial [Clostridia bacterium]|nr:DNA methyltransferase [Clostridia bacterium]